MEISEAKTSVSGAAECLLAIGEDKKSKLYGVASILALSSPIYHFSFVFSMLRRFSNFPEGSLASSTMKLGMINQFNTDEGGKGGV